MDMWAKVGVKCVCISDFWHNADVSGPHQREEITILAIYVNQRGFLMLRFSEYPGWDDGEGGNHGYHIRNFRPLVSQEDDVELFRYLLTDTCIPGKW